jgi:hypothetical protein
LGIERASRGFAHFDSAGSTFVARSHEVICFGTFYCQRQGAIGHYREGTWTYVVTEGTATMNDRRGGQPSPELCLITIEKSRQIEENTRVPVFPA